MPENVLMRFLFVSRFVSRGVHRALL